MSLRIVVLGQVPDSLGPVLEAQRSALQLSLVAHATDAVAARAALRPADGGLTPEIALVGASLADGSTFDLIRALPAEARPAALVVVGTREEEAVTAFELRATDFVLWPAPAERVGAALVRASQVALQQAMARTVDDLQRLIDEASALAAKGPGDGGAWAGMPVSKRRRMVGGRATGTLVASAPWRLAPGAAGGAGLPSVGRDDAEEAVLDLSREDGGRAGQLTPPLRVQVREGRRTRFVPIAEVDWFEADGNYIRVHAAGAAYRTRGTISAIETALDPRQFVRIHRRVVVNMDRVRELTPLPGGDGLLLLGNGSTLRLSRTYRSRVR